MRSMFTLIMSILILLMLSATADCNCLVPSNNSIGIDHDDFMSVFTDSPSDIEANYAALNRAVSLLNVTFTRPQLAAFLGVIRHNTENLRRHQAQCAETGTCSDQYDTGCNSNRMQNDTRQFYPRSALMIAYQCNYADIDSILRSSLPCLRSIEAEPDLLADRLLYSYLASVATWSSTECMSLTSDNLDQLPICMNILNPWLCTDDGQSDRQDLLASVGVALDALNMTDVQAPSDLCPVLYSGNMNTTNVTTDMSNISNVTVTNMSGNSNVTNATDPNGTLTRDLFRSYFSGINRSVVDANFDGLLGALMLSGVDRLNTKQIAFLLAAIKSKTNSLSEFNATYSDADRARATVQLMLNLLSRGLPADLMANVDPNLVLFYSTLIHDAAQSGCFADVSQSLYDVCLGAMFPDKTCALDEAGHDDIVDSIADALVLQNVGDDVSSSRCQDMTSHATMTSSLSTWTVAVLAVVCIMTAV